MDIFSFTNNQFKVKRDIKQNNLYNLIQKTVVNNPAIQLKGYTVPREMEMRLDRVSEWIYGSNNYVEELMAINDIICPYSIKEGQEILFCDITALNSLYTTDKLEEDSTNKKQLVEIGRAHV